MPRAAVVTGWLMVLALGFGLACAQEGTPNLVSPVPWQGENTKVTGEARFFEGSGNETVALSVRSRLDQSSDVEVCYFSMDTRGEDPIGGAVRRSEADLLSVNAKWLLKDGSVKVALRPGLALRLTRPTGANTSTGAYAAQGGSIPTLSLPMEWGDPESGLLMLQPKAAWFKDNIPNSVGGVTKGFGSVIALGVGAVYNVDYHLGSFGFVGDATVVLSGNNSIDETSNTVTDDLVWSAGVRWDAGGRYDLNVVIFATNAAGPTPAMSLIAAPDQSSAVGARVSGEF